jgi:four helix bundle protein
VGALAPTLEGQVIGRQLLKSGTSPGAHYREAHRSRSNAEFISKIDGALQELDESAYWLELLIETNLGEMAEANLLLAETNELIAIFVTCSKNAKNRRDEHRSHKREKLAVCIFILHPSAFILGFCPAAPCDSAF